jgi:hypothetical protein
MILVIISDFKLANDRGKPEENEIFKIVVIMHLDNMLR